MDDRTGRDDAAEIRAWRRAVRQRLLEARTTMPLEEHQAKSAAVVGLLTAEFPWIRTRRVGIYWPYRREISLLGLADRILEEGGAVSLPVVVEKGRPVQFRNWRPGDPLSRDSHGIAFPREGAAVAPDVLIVALVGFDAGAFRLGYGSGYYDRTLAAADPRPTTIGVGFELMRLETIRPQPHDIPMDFIVTEAGVAARRPPAA